MKKLFILLVVFFATCINTYASNHSAGKNSDAEYASCNIQTMLTDPKSTQWFRHPMCTDISHASGTGEPESKRERTIKKSACSRLSQYYGAVCLFNRG